MAYKLLPLTDQTSTLEIMVIEDNEDHTYFIRKSLDPQHYHITHFPDAKQALDYIYNSHPVVHVIILDFRLPSMDGLDFLKELRARGGDYACIFLTIENKIETAVEAMKLGAMDFLPKTHNFYASLPARIEKVHLLHQAHLEKKWIEERLITSEQKYREIFNNVNDAIFLQRTDGENIVGPFMEVNDVACRDLGYSRDELLEMAPTDIVAPDESHLISNNMAKLTRQQNLTFEHTLIAKDGHRIPVEISAHLFFHGSEKRILSIIRDITERKKTETELKYSLHEKELLLREIHHRVKNNLSIISSLLHFQEMHTGSSHLSVETILANTRNRIKSIALAHEKLYRTENHNLIHFSDYCRDLIKHLMRSFYSDTYPRPISMNIDVDEIALDIDIIIPCGLIINELVTNAFKHAFPRHESTKWQLPEKPEIAVHFHPDKEKEGEYCLKVTNNGKPLPSDFNPDGVDTLGLFIVRSLVDQLDGRLDVERGERTAFIIRFNRE